MAQTAFLFLRYRLLSGLLDRAAYTVAATQLLSAISAEPRLSSLVARIERARLLLE